MLKIRDRLSKFRTAVILLLFLLIHHFPGGVFFISSLLELDLLKYLISFSFFAIEKIFFVDQKQKIPDKALLSALMRVFEKKSFGGQEQYINKQTGYTADCNEMKTFLQREMNSQNNNYYPYQNNYSNYGWSASPSVQFYENKKYI